MSIGNLKMGCFNRVGVPNIIAAPRCGRLCNARGRPSHGCTDGSTNQNQGFSAQTTPQGAPNARHVVESETGGALLDIPERTTS